MDIEDLVQLGRKWKACPYYATRAALPNAELVVVPYASIISKPAREALGAELKDSVVVIDEGHNLVDAVNEIHSTSMTLEQATVAANCVQAYVDKFRVRLAAGNLRHLQSLLQVVTALMHLLGGDAATAVDGNGKHKDGSTVVRTVNEFTFDAAVDNINLFKLQRYLAESNILEKLSGYADAFSLQTAEADNSCTPSRQQATSSALSSLQTLSSLISALTSADADGRVVVKREQATGSIRFVMLNAGRKFKEIVEQARAVLLAGGTLSPVSHLISQLFAQVPPSRLLHFSCGHVVGKESLLVLALGKGPGGGRLELSYTTREDPRQMEEVGRVVVNASRVCPGGVIVFFPSFAYADAMYNFWLKRNILTSISANKKVFREPRAAAEVESLLQEYREWIVACREQQTSTIGSKAQGTGALLMCVVGGKMSEGINFSDDFGRCIIVVGLPYANPSDPELQERMRYLNVCESNVKHSGKELIGDACTVPANKKRAGREYYEDLCMKAVNQSIGRAIRHKGDYAAILLLDARYTCEEGPSAKLPGWIRDSLVHVKNGFGEAQARLTAFFKTRAKTVQ
eukprot:jgi/Chlat1/7529/Chrsp62S07037